MVETLVQWGAGVKFIEHLTKSPASAKYARLVYKSLGTRPPSGMTGAANSLRLRTCDLKTFTAMANRYIDVLNKGIPRNHASMTVYSAFIEQREKSAPISVNLWLAFTREVESNRAGVFRCTKCSGAHLWQQSANREYKHCLWCKDKFKKTWTAASAEIEVKLLMKNRFKSFD